MRDKWIGAEIYCHHDSDKAVFDSLAADKVAIEAEFGGPLEWERLDNPLQKGSRIAIRLRSVDPGDATRWDEYAKWYSAQVAKLRKCFSGRVQRLDLDTIRENRPPGDL